MNLIFASLKFFFWFCRFAFFFSFGWIFLYLFEFPLSLVSTIFLCFLHVSCSVDFLQRPGKPRQALHERNLKCHSYVITCRVTL